MVHNPSRELKEKTRHGNQLFPIAGYLWSGGSIPENVSLHWHPEIEIIRVLRGSFTLQVNFEQIQLNSGNIAIIPANMLHGMILPVDCIEDALLFNAKAVSLSAFDEVEKEILEHLASGSMPLPPIIERDSPLYAKLSTLIDEAFTFLDQNSPASKLKVKARLLEILAICYESGLLNRYKSKTSLSEDQAQDKLKELLSYLNDNFTQKLNVDDAAQKLKFSKPYFCRFFKKATGMSFIDYLNDLRLRKAARELLLSNREVVELASEFGFDNVSYFYRLFKRKFKVTPKEYRNLTVKASQDNLKE